MQRRKVKVVDENGTEWPATVYERVEQLMMAVEQHVPSKYQRTNSTSFLVPRALGMDHTFTLNISHHGENLDENLKATVIVRNDGIIDTSNAVHLTWMTTLSWEPSHNHWIRTKQGCWTKACKGIRNPRAIRTWTNHEGNRRIIAS